MSHRKIEISHKASRAPKPEIGLFSYDKMSEILARKTHA